jgi:hypothetical protein
MLDLLPEGWDKFYVPEPISVEATIAYCSWMAGQPHGRVYGWFDDQYKPKGFLAGYVRPDPWTGEMQGYEHAWWVVPANRGAVSMELMHAFENDCRADGCRRVSFGYSSYVNGRALQRMYRKIGYETHMIAVTKELK